jgi:2-polyprenyl-3-methyl-5-hydroxy-6-metoxy-1,4-benzoquinol methylase
LKSSNQQKQTKEFFESFSQKWSENAKTDRSDFVNIIKIRNQYVESICANFLKKNSKILDVGCGTGDLVISLLKNDYDAFGIDFAASMITEAKSEARKSNLPENKFIVSSFLDYEPETKFNLISANGFVEYISEKEFHQFIKKSYDYLDENGIIVFELRNRLFNVFSFNNYTKAEIELGEINNLLDECIAFNNAANLSELRNLKSKLTKNLHHHEQTKDKYASIAVDTRYQYSPSQIINLLQENNFNVMDLYPVHIHGITTGAKKVKPDIHTILSYYLLDQKDIHLQLIPQSSSFMICAKK